MPVFTGEVSVKLTVDVSIVAENQAAAEAIARNIYAESNCPEFVTETGEYSEPMFVHLFHAAPTY